MSVDWTEVKAILAEAFEREGVDRAAYLNNACGSDERLRDRVDELIALETSAASRLDPLIMDGASASPPEDESHDVAGRRIGRYEIRRVLGTGGMGVVYEAVQDQPHRVVALKVLRRGVASREALGRFRHEAEILGRLKHPNIAQVHDAGTLDEGEGAQPYFAMEYVSGQPLTQYAERAALTSNSSWETRLRDEVDDLKAAQAKEVRVVGGGGGFWNGFFLELFSVCCVVLYVK